MIDYVEKELIRCEKLLLGYGERDRPVYEEEQHKEHLKARANLCRDILDMPQVSPGIAVKKFYRVELVDYIDATSEHEAIDIFTQAMADVCLADDNFDVYEVDPKTRKAVR